jgi:hypothetical protein
VGDLHGGLVAAGCGACPARPPSPTRHAKIFGGTRSWRRIRGRRKQRRDDVALEVKSGCPKSTASGMGNAALRVSSSWCALLRWCSSSRRDGGGTSWSPRAGAAWSPFALPCTTCQPHALHVLLQPPRASAGTKLASTNCRFSEMTTSRGRTFQAGAAVAAVATVGAVGAIAAVASGAAVAATRAGRGGAGGAILSSSQGVGSVAKSASSSEPSSEL